MNASVSMLWRTLGRNRWESMCGRYEIRRATGADGRIVLCVLFYGYIALRQFQEYTDAEPPRDLQRWCESHRLRLLPRIQIFEDWAAKRYGVNFSRAGWGPLDRCERIRATIAKAGDGSLVLHFPGGAKRISERFAELYQSIEPQAAEVSA